MKRTLRWLAALGALCVALPAFAQDEPEAETTIVVTGRAEPPSRGEVAEQARELSRVGRYQLYEEALPRVEAPLCPAVFGLRDEYAAEMVARVRANAERLDLPLAEAGCAPNLLVAFLDDGESFLGALERKHPDLFGLIAESERNELLNEPAPVRVWNNIALRWTGAGPPPNGWPKVRPSVRGQLSRNAMPEARDIVTSLVVFEREAVVGMTLAQLADYATMRGLSHTRPANGEQPMATILAMFEEGTGELTPFDIGYLRSLYYSASNLSAASRFVRVRGRVEEAREEAAAP